MEGAPKAKTVAKNGDEEDPTTEADSKATPAVSRAALAASGGAAGPDDEIDFAALVPDFGVELGLGVIAGFSSGYAVKKVGKLAALTVGLGFIAMQVARHYGVLKKEHMPDLSKLDRAIKASLDVDGDGKVTSKVREPRKGGATGPPGAPMTRTPPCCPASQDLNTLANRGFSMLSANMPAASGFGVAFLFGLRYG